nr:RNA-directed DNA polymerase [Paenibacillus nuruki]
MVLLKKYSDFMNELNNEDIFEGLLGYGLFSEKLPPIFDSVPFYKYCKNFNPKFENTPRETNFIRYENMRNINIPRSIGIPNPMNYYQLCFFIKNHWDKLKDFFEKQTQNQTIKVSRLHIRKMRDTKIVFKMNYKNYKIDGEVENEDFLIGSKYIVNVDISTCFPSIYTHSLAWALAGKEIAKKNRSEEHWFNKLDFHVRNIKNGETHGILIGPHTSNLLSEIVLVFIDKVLIDKGWKYFRNIDDYTCYVKNYDEVQKFLVDINEALKKFNLILNHKKTTISVLPIPSTESWISKLNALSINEKEYWDYKNTELLINTAIYALHSNNNNAAILNYMIKIFHKKKLSKNAKKYYVKKVLHLAVIYPYLIQLIDNYIFEEQELDSNIISRFSNIIYEEGFMSNNYESVCYALFFSIKYNFEIKSIDFEKIRNSNHAILNLLGYLYCCNSDMTDNKKQIKVFKNLAKELLENKEDFQENWVFVYEVLSIGHFNKENSDWKKLKDNKVSFLNAMLLGVKLKQSKNSV